MCLAEDCDHAGSGSIEAVHLSSSVPHFDAKSLSREPVHYTPVLGGTWLLPIDRLANVLLRFIVCTLMRSFDEVARLLLIISMV